MAVSATPYGLFLQSLVEGRVNMSADQMKMMICTADYVPNPNTHKFKNSVNNEIVGSGYTPKIVTGLVTTYATINKTLSIAAGNVSWPSVTWTGAKWGVLYMSPTGATASAMPLVGYVDFSTEQNRDNAPFYVNWPSGILMKLSVL
jgi:hypothetical protein